MVPAKPSAESNPVLGCVVTLVPELVPELFPALLPALTPELDPELVPELVLELEPDADCPVCLNCGAVSPAKDVSCPSLA